MPTWPSSHHHITHAHTHTHTHTFQTLILNYICISVCLWYHVSIHMFCSLSQLVFCIAVHHQLERTDFTLIAIYHHDVIEGHGYGMRSRLKMVSNHVAKVQIRKTFRPRKSMSVTKLFGEDLRGWNILQIWTLVTWMLTIVNLNLSQPCVML